MATGLLAVGAWRVYWRVPMRWWWRVPTFAFATGLAFLFGLVGSLETVALGFAAAFGAFALIAYDTAYRYQRSRVPHPFIAIWRGCRALLSRGDRKVQ